MVDGNLGPATVRELQAYLGTTQDGVISTPYSSMVRVFEGTGVYSQPKEKT